MFRVVDPNVIISAVMTRGNSSMVFSLNYIKNKFEFISPLFTYVELGKHSEKIARKTHIPLNEVKGALNFVMKQITFIGEEEYQDKLNEARQILKGHEKDVPYLALAIKLNCKIFSGDKILKQYCKEKIITPKEVLEEFDYL